MHRQRLDGRPRTNLAFLTSESRSPKKWCAIAHENRQNEAYCDVPPSIQAERHPTRQPAGAAGTGEQADHAGQQPRGPAAVEEAAVTAVSAVTIVSGAAVTGVTSL